jgi:hypothetical protein
MRIAIDVKNMSKMKEPSANDVIVYDGRQWYVTTKDDILKEANEALSKCEKTLARLEAENREFKQQTSKDIIEIANTTKKLLKMKEGDL